MKSLDLNEAAKFLHMNAETLRRKAKLKEIPGRKYGRRWVFFEEQLADLAVGGHSTGWQSAQVDEKKTNSEVLCRSINAKGRIFGGLRLVDQINDEYNEALGLKTKKKPKNSTTD